MLRLAALLLLLANVLTWSYTQGHWASLGLQPEQQREPERLGQQVNPDKLQLKSTAIEPATPPQAEPPPAPEPPAAVATDPTPPAPTACWQASGYNASQTILLNAALQKLPGMDKRWTLAESVVPGRWIVYLGKFPNADALQRSRDTLRQAGIEHRDVNSPTLSPGLALGTFSTEEAAQKALQSVAKDGVRGAKVVQVRPEVRSVTLRLPAINESEREQIARLPVLADKTLQPCPQ
jgi:SPOR domain